MFRLRGLLHLHVVRRDVLQGQIAKACDAQPEAFPFQCVLHLLALKHLFDCSKILLCFN